MSRRIETIDPISIGLKRRFNYVSFKLGMIVTKLCVYVVELFTNSYELIQGLAQKLTLYLSR